MPNGDASAPVHASHCVRPAFGWVPGSHFTHAVCSRFATLPSSALQSWHTVPVPAVPAGHGSQCVCRLFGRVPATQLMHDALSKAATLPSKQATQTPDPAFPSSHVMHSDNSLQVSAGHSVPGPQLDTRVHATNLPPSSTIWFGALQSSHEIPYFEYVPAPQSSQPLRAAFGFCPASHGRQRSSSPCRLRNTR